MFLLFLLLTAGQVQALDTGGLFALGHQVAEGIVGGVEMILKLFWRNEKQKKHRVSNHPRKRITKQATVADAKGTGTDSE